MSVDYRLLPHFAASRARLQSARLVAAAPTSRLDERRLAVREQARKHLELVRGAPRVPRLDDR